MKQKSLKCNYYLSFVRYILMARELFRLQLETKSPRFDGPSRLDEVLIARGISKVETRGRDQRWSRNLAWFRGQDYIPCFLKIKNVFLWTNLGSERTTGIRSENIASNKPIASIRSIEGSTLSSPQCWDQASKTETYQGHSVPR